MFQKYSKGLVLTLMALALCVSSVFAAPAYASPTFSAQTTPTKTAYYLGEDVGVTLKLEWQGLSQDYTTNVELWNSTHKIDTIKTGLLVSGSTDENGTLSETYTVSGLTTKTGQQTYTVKVVDTGSGLTVANSQLSFTVQDSSVVMSVAWEDANQDRIIDVSESVTFNVYLTWAFMNDTTPATLKVNDAGFEKVIDNVSVTAGSGSATKTYITSFDGSGSKTVVFKLEDAEGETLASKTVAVSVGVPSGSGDMPYPISTQVDSASISDALYENRYMLILVAGIAVIGILLLRRK